MNLLPADTYIVENSTILTEIDKKVIINLYEPIIGSNSVSLYLTLWSDLDKMELISSNYTHHHLMTILKSNLETIKMAAELGENVALAKRAGLLHDIGKAIDFEVDGSHVELGEEIAKKYREDAVVINAIKSHHGDTESTSVISTLVQIADTLSAARPGARNDSLENYIKRLEQLEQISNDIKGVEKSYALQAGRELRVLVKPEEITDLESYKVAREIKERIEKEMQYPGTIKVTVVRETRVVEEAK